MSNPPLPRLKTIPPQVVALDDYLALARPRISPMAWEYLDSGVADEFTLGENRAAFARILLKGRVLREVQGGSTQLRLLGQDFPLPVLLSPLAYQRLFHPDGELASAVGASALGAGMIVSTLASCLLQEIASVAQSPLWFQLYWQADMEHNLALIRQAEAAGYRALVLTVDAPLAGIRNRIQRAGFALPPGVAAVNLQGVSAPPMAFSNNTELRADAAVFAQMQRAPRWQDIAKIASASRLPLLIKGILDPEDACRALDHGAAGIIISNHGGRVQDYLPASIDALPAIAQAIAGRIPLLLDGGIRRGSDIFKALALGANAVCIGRPYIHGLASAGALGVAHVLRILQEELAMTMALSGCASLAEIEVGCLFKS